MFTKLACYLFGHEDVAPAPPVVTIHMPDEPGRVEIPLDVQMHCKFCGSPGLKAKRYTASIHVSWGALRPDAVIEPLPSRTAEIWAGKGWVSGHFRNLSEAERAYLKGFGASDPMPSDFPRDVKWIAKATPNGEVTTPQSPIPPSAYSPWPFGTNQLPFTADR